MAISVKRSTHFLLETEDKPGTLARTAKQLRDGGVNLKGLWGFAKGQGRAQIFLVPENPAAFKQACQKSGLSVKEGTLFHLSGQDKPGALCDLLDKIAAAGINLQAVQAISTGDVFGSYLWTDPKDVEAAGKVLGA